MGAKIPFVLYHIVQVYIVKLWIRSHIPKRDVRAFGCLFHKTLRATHLYPKWLWNFDTSDFHPPLSEYFLCCISYFPNMWISLQVHSLVDGITFAVPSLRRSCSVTVISEQASQWESFSFPGKFQISTVTSEKETKIHSCLSPLVWKSTASNVWNEMMNSKIFRNA